MKHITFKHKAGKSWLGFFNATTNKQNIGKSILDILSMHKASKKEYFFFNP